MWATVTTRIELTAVMARAGWAVALGLVLLLLCNLAVGQADPFTQQGAKLVGSEVLETSAEQGYSVALSANGETAVVGGIADHGYRGAVWVFTRTGVNWTQQAKLIATDLSEHAQEGYSVALSADGNTALIGGPSEEGTGAAWVFTRMGTQLGPASKAHRHRPERRR